MSVLPLLSCVPRLRNTSCVSILSDRKHLRTSSFRVRNFVGTECVPLVSGSCRTEHTQELAVCSFVCLIPLLRKHLLVQCLLTEEYSRTECMFLCVSGSFGVWFL